MRLLRTVCCLALTLLCASVPARSQQVTVDVSGAHAMYRALLAMRDGAPKADASRQLDTVLATRPYRTMFRHYNRSWRPNHLPESVFKRMILSLRFPEEYAKGENQRADQMLPFWRRAYDNLPLYAANLRQLDETDLQALATAGVREAQRWLPPEWKIRDFYLPVMPNGGSRAFTIDSAQSYDFFQLARDSAGMIMWPEIASVFAHESHHLGVQTDPRRAMSRPDSIAHEFLAMFMPEGTASKFIDGFPGGCVPSIDGRQPGPSYAYAKADWQRLAAREPELFDHLAATFERARSGTLSRDSLQAEIGAYWLSGYISPVYFVGAELYGAIYVAYGKEGAFTAMRDPFKALPMYRDAVKKRPDLLGTCHVMPDSVVRHAQTLGHGGG